MPRLMVRVILMTCFFFFSTFYMTYFFFSTFYINHNLPFMNDGEGLVPLFTRVLSSIPSLATYRSLGFRVQGLGLREQY